MGRQQKSSIGRKIGLSLGFILVSTVYAVWQHIGTGQSVASADQTPPTTTNAPITITASEPLQPKPAIVHPPEPKPIVVTPPPPQKPAGLYADGSYTGNPADAYYGTVQVRAVVRGGNITDVQFLQHPDSRQNSARINSEAMPLLTQEAIQAQSAEVDGVSGATFTSGAFRESLAAALALAKN